MFIKIKACHKGAKKTEIYNALRTVVPYSFFGAFSGQKSTDISDILLNICWGYSLEVPHRGTSNEYPQHIFHGELRKINIWNYEWNNFNKKWNICTHKKEFLHIHQEI